MHLERGAAGWGAGMKGWKGGAAGDLRQVDAPAGDGPLEVNVGLAHGLDGRLREAAHVPELHQEAHHRLHELLRPPAHNPPLVKPFPPSCSADELSRGHGGKTVLFRPEHKASTARSMLDMHLPIPLSMTFHDCPSHLPFMLSARIP